MRVITSYDPSTNLAHLYYGYPGGALVEFTLPAGTISVDAPTSFIMTRGRIYLFGTFAPGLVIDEGLFAGWLGLHPPTGTTTVAAAAAISAGLTDTFQCKVTAVAKTEDGAIVHESNGGQNASVTCAAQARQWVVPLNDYDTWRVTHLRGYVKASTTSVWRLAWERCVVGLTATTITVTEEVTTLSLGAEIPTEHDVPPYCAFAVMYQGKAFMAGDPKTPSMNWYSLAGKPEAVSPLNGIRSKGREPVTALFPRGNMLYTWTHFAMDAIRGYDESSDLRIDRITPGYGNLSHFSTVVVDERLAWAAPEGAVLLDAFPRLISMEINRYWNDAYAAAPRSFEGAFGVYDRRFRCYLLHLRKTTGMFRFVAYMPPAIAGEQPWWYFDERNRTDTATGVFCAANAKRQFVVTGSSDGYLREENYESDYTDDGDVDSLGVGIKRVTLQSRHEPGDDDNANQMEGKVFSALDVFLTSENNTWVASLYGGQNAAASAATAHWTSGTVAASYDATLTPQWEHNFRPDGVGGAGVTLKLVANQARSDFRFRGYALGYGPGSNVRSPAA
jgi:hypothetical protein